MKLKSVMFSQESEDGSSTWGFQSKLTLRGIDLIVGKNSVGKTKVLNIISSFSKKILEESTFPISNYFYKAVFLGEDGGEYDFELKEGPDKIDYERFSENGKKLMERTSSGDAQFFGVEIDQNIRFKFDLQELAARRSDILQFPYLEKMRTWSLQLKHIRFNTDLGRSSIYHQKDLSLQSQSEKIKDRETILAFSQGYKVYGEAFKKAIIQDLKSVGFLVSDIGLCPPLSLQIEKIGTLGTKNHEFISLFVQECDREGRTDQYIMSMGFFRVISLLVFFNYWEFSKKDSFILIDNIGEGLDYERANKLVKLIIEKSEKNNNTQVVMSTNNQFVMNNIPLKYWQVIDREGAKVKFYNIENSKQTFDDFKFVGLNNFDFFTSNFYKQGFDSEK